MPFVQRVVSPTFLSRSGRVGAARRSVSGRAAEETVGSDSVCGLGNHCAVISEDPHCSKESDVIAYCGSTATSGGGQKNHPSGSRSGGDGRSACNNSPMLVSGNELESVINITLSNALRQLASLVIIANDIFLELNEELQNIGDRSKEIKRRIITLESTLDRFDPKLVAVPESDLNSFAQIKNHFCTKKPIDQQLFTDQTRSTNIKVLYEAAAKAPHSTLEDYKVRESDEFTVLELSDKTKQLQSKIDAEIETRLPAVVEELRRWTSIEALGDMTVTPDCVNRVGCRVCTNQTLQSVNNYPSTTFEDDTATLACSHSNQPTEINDNIPLDHRLPSPEEQCHIIAQKFPAELVSVDISGRRFERMCLARKTLTSIVNVDSNNCENDEEEVRRRSRSRKPRGKRRNTIAGTDQKEIEEVATEKNEITKSSHDLSDREYKVSRSKSNEGVKSSSIISSSATDIGKATITRFNSLKLWSRQRLKLINRNTVEKQKSVENVIEANSDANGNKSKRRNTDKDKRAFHERKSSYSSSEKSLMLNSQNTIRVCDVNASVNPVKLRESSSLRRQRRSAIYHKDEPHSSSGNWSASSESGRASIGSEITIQPKSSASSTSLNQSHVHPSSGPPSSIISRRRFLNTSASSSVTSEGTATPDLQVNDICYDDETSSAYSCDTEGYYTSFHVDSGLKTLKEEDPLTPMHSTSALSSTNSFEGSSNQTILTAENEYELFGRGSTSTTTSSAGTVCTTLMAGESDRSLLKAPDAPERKSSLIKLSRSSSNASNSTLERSYSSSTVGSTLERSGTIKRNGVLLRKEAPVVQGGANDKLNTEEYRTRCETPDDVNQSPKLHKNSVADNLSQCGLATSELEYSESSDLEGVDRIERIKQKTTINSSRIPSMCIITPTTSDDENTKEIDNRKRQPMPVPVAETRDNLNIDFANKAETYQNKWELKSLPSILPTVTPSTSSTKKISLHPLNHMLGKLKGVLPNIKKLPEKEHSFEQFDDTLYDSIGEYVRIADVTNNNNSAKPGTGVYYSNDVVRRNLAAVLSGNLNQETEYVSLNELPCNLRREDKSIAAGSSKISGNVRVGEKINSGNIAGDALLGDDGNTKEENELHKGARVKFDARGKIIYNSDSLKRRKPSHSTFIPGPYVKEDDCAGVSVSPNSNSSFVFTPKHNASELSVENDKASHQTSKKNNQLGKISNSNKQVSSEEETDEKMERDELICSLNQPHVEKGYPHLSHKPINGVETPPLQRTNPVYWTLQSKKRPRSRNLARSDDLNALIDGDRGDFFSMSADDSYSSESIHSNDFIREYSSSSCNISPIMPRTDSTDGIKTSTPVRTAAQESLEERMLRLNAQKYPSRSNYNSDAQNSRNCSDRLGASKTSLMDFKKLLLAKSSKSSTVGKVSAVEILKLNKQEIVQPKKKLNSSMNILELSGSPKTFANRRMLKQGIFGSPSKTIAMNQRGVAWRMNVSRTDVISTAIPEANSEEDNSSSSSSTNTIENLVPEKCVIEESVDLKRNIFLETEKNNFMKGEVALNASIKSSLLRSNIEKTRAQFFAKKDENLDVSTAHKLTTDDKVEQFLPSNDHEDSNTESIKSTPALETAL